MNDLAGPLTLVVTGMALLVVALVSAPPVSIAAVVAVVLLVGLVVSRINSGFAGVLCAVGFAFTTSWNAVVIGPVRPADAFLLLGLALLVLDRSTESVDHPRSGPLLPWWLLLLAFAIVGVTVLNEILPFAPEYLHHRPEYDAATGAVIDAPGTNIGGAVRWLVSLLGVPALVGLSGQHRRAALRWIAMAFVAGTAVAGFVALTDRFGITAISQSLTIDRFGDRQASLTIQPNHLATVCVLGLPLACWLFVGVTRLSVKALAVLAVVLDILGIVFSGSRGGAAVGVLTLVSAVLMLRDLRARVLQIAVGGAVVLAGVLYANPSLVDLAESTTRLNSSAGASDSDQVRNLLGNQANLDFAKSPLYGLGLQLIVTAHNIFKQMLASGGLLLILAFAVFIVAMIHAGRRAWQVDQLAVAATVSVVSWLVIGAVENNLIDRYLYVPVGILVALGVRHRDEADYPLGVSPPGVHVATSIR